MRIFYNIIVFLEHILSYRWLVPHDSEQICHSYLDNYCDWNHWRVSADMNSNAFPIWLFRIRTTIRYRSEIDRTSDSQIQYLIPIPVCSICYTQPPRIVIVWSSFVFRWDLYLKVDNRTILLHVETIEDVLRHFQIPELHLDDCCLIANRLSMTHVHWCQPIENDNHRLVKSIGRCDGRLSALIK